MQVWFEKTRLGVAFKVGVGPGVAAGAWHRVPPSLQPGKRPQATQARLSPAPAAYERRSKASRRQHVVGNECALIWCSDLVQWAAAARPIMWESIRSKLPQDYVS